MWSTLPVCTTAGPSTARIFSPASRVRLMAAAISRTATPLGFSLNTGLAMTSKRFCRAAVSAENAQPLPADDNAVSSADVGHGQAAGGRPFEIDEDAAVHFLVLDV